MLRMTWPFTLLLVLLAIAGTPRARAQDTVDILLDMDTPPISADLSAYIAFLDRIPLSPIVGFNGTDIGYGPGDGVNEDVPFSFNFTPFLSVSSATLTLELTPLGDVTFTDVILFADETSVCCDGEPDFLPYGRYEFSSVFVLGEPVTVTLDLMGLKDASGVPTWDRSSLLSDGDLDVLYIDDALVHSARLQISGAFEGTVATESIGWGTVKALYRD